MVLRRRATDEREAREVDHGVDRDAALPEEVLLDGTAEVEAAGVDAHDLGAARFQLEISET